MNNRNLDATVNRLIDFMAQDEDMRVMSYPELKGIMIEAQRVLPRFMGITLREAALLEKQIPGVANNKKAVDATAPTAAGDEEKK